MNTASPKKGKYLIARIVVKKEWMKINAAPVVLKQGKKKKGFGYYHIP